MKNLKKAFVGLTIAAVLALGGAFAAHAQYNPPGYNPPGAGPYNPPGYNPPGVGYGALYNPISQWIVISGLFAPQLATGSTVDGTVNSALSNPISQWIVLSGLFNPFYGGLYGGLYY